MARLNAYLYDKAVDDDDEHGQQKALKEALESLNDSSTKDEVMPGFAINSEQQLNSNLTISFFRVPHLFHRRIVRRGHRGGFGPNGSANRRGTRVSIAKAHADRQYWSDLRRSDDLHRCLLHALVTQAHNPWAPSIP